MNEHGGVAYKNIRKKTSLHLSKQKSQSSPCLACNFFSMLSYYFFAIVQLFNSILVHQMSIFFCYPKTQIMPTSSFSLLSRVVRIVKIEPDLRSCVSEVTWKTGHWLVDIISGFPIDLCLQKLGCMVRSWGPNFNWKWILNI